MSEAIAIGFIGLGAMGWPMAANLLEKGPKHANLYIFDIVSPAMQKLHALDEKRVLPCQSAKEVASRSVSKMPQSAQLNCSLRIRL